jgi:hypothetical protein
VGCSGIPRAREKDILCLLTVEVGVAHGGAGDELKKYIDEYIVRCALSRSHSLLYMMVFSKTFSFCKKCLSVQLDGNAKPRTAYFV